MEEKELRKIITQKIEKTKSVQEEEKAIGGFITVAFEEGRITEAEFYRLSYQRMIIDRLDNIKASMQEG